MRNTVAKRLRKHANVLKKQIDVENNLRMSKGQISVLKNSPYRLLKKMYTRTPKNQKHKFNLWLKLLTGIIIVEELSNVDV